MSRRICVDLYNALIKLGPEWAEETLKVVITGSGEDGPEWQKHIRSKEARRKLANRFKDAKDPFKIVIVGVSAQQRVKKWDSRQRARRAGRLRAGR